jgi:hypothetical protein
LKYTARLSAKFRFFEAKKKADRDFDNIAKGDVAGSLKANVMSMFEKLVVKSTLCSIAGPALIVWGVEPVSAPPRSGMALRGTPFKRPAIATPVHDMEADINAKRREVRMRKSKTRANSKSSNPCAKFQIACIAALFFFTLRGCKKELQFGDTSSSGARSALRRRPQPLWALSLAVTAAC